MVCLFDLSCAVAVVCLFAGSSCATSQDDNYPRGDSGSDQSDAAELTPGLADAIRAVKSGGEADLDGDGTIDLVSIVADGSRVTQLKAGDRVALEVVRRGDGTTEKIGDLNLDGMPDYAEREQTTSTHFTRLSEQDTNYDGVTDRRERYELHLDQRTLRTVTEVLRDGTWATEADVTRATGRIRSGDGCEDHYPDEDEVHTEEITLIGRIRVVQCRTENRAGCVTSLTKGACTRAEVARIRSELTSLFRDELAELKPLKDVGIEDSSVVECLRRRQAPFLEALISNLAGGSVEGAQVPSRFDGARIACGVHCDGALGTTDEERRLEVNINISQRDHELRDTLLHELIHAAGYDGSADHDDADSAQDDAVYACARWCTGHSLRSPDSTGAPVYDPEGELDMHDCFRCSGTPATKQECCGDKHACVGGCCDAPCLPDGTCAIDPCDPQQNHGDFSKCRFKGESTLIVEGGGCEVTLDWTFRSVEGNKVSLKAKGRASCDLGNTGPCSVIPTGVPVSESDGALIFDYSTRPPTYAAYGVSKWPITLICPDMEPLMSALGTPWIESSSAVPFTPGSSIAGQVREGAGVLVWSFEPY